MGKAGMGKEQQVAGRYLPIYWPSVEVGGGGGSLGAEEGARTAVLSILLLHVTNSFSA
jgi:hypothetical protein